MQNRLSFNHSLIFILVSTLFISGSAWMGWLYYLQMRDKRLNDDQYNIVAIMQNCGQAESLKTAYLAELLDLSVDQPGHLYRFNTRQAQKKLTASPLIQKADIKKVLPGTLYICYQLRIPFAFFGHGANAVIDKSGTIFPFKPFFTPKRLPILFVNKDQLNWKYGDVISDQELQLAKKLIHLIEKMKLEDVFLKQIDLTQMHAESYGQRQIVLILEKCMISSNNENDPKTVYLRLGTKNYDQHLINFSHLYKHQKESWPKQTIIDLRLPHLALISRSH